MADDPRIVVSTDWLEAHLKDPDLRVLDVSWYLPDAGRDPKAEYDAAHIPGTRFVPRRIGHSSALKGFGY